jgi:hypothetical protein
MTAQATNPAQMAEATAKDGQTPMNTIQLALVKGCGVTKVATTQSKVTTDTSTAVGSIRSAVAESALVASFRIQAMKAVFG